MAEVVTRRRRVAVRPFVKTLLAGDKNAASQLARDLFAETGSRLAVFADLIHPAQYEIGDLWYEGRIGVADEHLATAIVEEIAGALPATPTEGRHGRGRCLLAAVGAEQHVVGLRLLAAVLEDDGWEVTLLGGRTPPAELLDMVKRVRPRFTGLSAAYLPSTGSLERTIQAIKSLGITVLVGGPAFNRNASLWRRLRADGHATDVRVAVAITRPLGR